MALEIERKFLLASDDWKGEAVRSERLVDGLLATSKGRKVRVRLYGDRATLAVKTRRAKGVRFEFEYDIPIEDAEQMLATQCGRTVLAKRRHYIPHQGFTWEVDVYEAPLDGVVLVEVELERADQDPPRPAWVGREVTDDPAYAKQRMFADRVGKRAATP